MGVIRVARRLFANTPVQKLPLTSRVYRRVFQYGFDSPELDLRFRGVLLTVPNTDATIVPGLAGGFYEQIELDVFEALCAGAGTVVDVGGNIGLYTCLAASRSPASCRVVVFEPVPANAEQLAANVARNGFSAKVTLFTEALGAEEGRARVYLASHSIGTHSLSPENANSSTSIEVGVSTLDRRLRGERVDVLKVDVEGFEGAVLEGARATIERDRPALLTEFVPHHLANCGYDPRRFAELLFGWFDEVFVVNELKRTIGPVTREGLAAFGTREIDLNLIAASRPEHVERIRSCVAAR